MKLLNIIACMIVVFSQAGFAQQAAEPKLYNENIVKEKSFDGRMRLAEDMKNSIFRAPDEMESKTVFRIIGGAALIGFLASVTIFKQDLFGTVPLTLLAAGIVFFIISV